MAESLVNQDWSVAIACVRGLHLVPVPANLKVSNSTVTEYQKNGGHEAGFTHVDAGIYLFDRSAVTAQPQEKFNLEYFWPNLIEQKKLGTFTVHDRFFDIGTPERLKFFEEHIHDYF